MNNNEAPWAHFRRSPLSPTIKTSISTVTTQMCPLCAMGTAGLSSFSMACTPDGQSFAEWLADQTREFLKSKVPVLWIRGMQTIRSIPLYVTGANGQWWIQPSGRPQSDMNTGGNAKQGMTHAPSSK